MPVKYFFIFLFLHNTSVYLSGHCGEKIRRGPPETDVIRTTRKRCHLWDDISWDTFRRLHLVVIRNCCRIIATKRHNPLKILRLEGIVSVDILKFLFQTQY